MTARTAVVGGVALWSLLLGSCVAVVSDRPTEHTPAVELIAYAWDGYRQRFIDAEGRVFRPRNSGDTVSEGQAYALLIASLLNDRPTFDRVMRWTQAHLSRRQRTGDHLLAWHWQPGLGVVDWNSASDADLDYALALVIASNRWHDPRYAREARLILSDVLDLETEVAGGRRYLLPGNWRGRYNGHIINPSYLSPAHFRVFFVCTGDTRWNDLIDGSYRLIDTVSHGFAGRSGVGLVPDWFRVAQDGALTPAEGLSDRFGWDAIRTPWRIGMDALWFREDRARRYLARMSNFYTSEWSRRGSRFFSEYTYEGQPVAAYEHTASYAMSLMALAISDSPILDGVLDSLRDRFDSAVRRFKETDDYYANSLALLGLILYREAVRPTIDLQQLNCRSVAAQGVR